MKHGYQGMDEGTKVYHLTTGIKTDSLNVIKSNILESPDLQRDFDKFVTLFKGFISSNLSSKEHSLNTSNLNTNRKPDGNKGVVGRRGGGRGRGNGRGNGGRGRCNYRSRKGVGNKRKHNGNESENSNFSFCYHTTKDYNLLSDPKKSQLK